MSNIFLKDCPQCTSSNPIDAVFCRCGFCFDPGQIKNTAESLAHLAHEEEIYLEYLQARVEQARVDLETQRAIADKDPANTTKRAELLLATQALSGAEAEYKAQHAKVQALSNHKNAVRFVREQAKAASDKVSSKKKKRTTRNVTKNITKGLGKRTKGKKTTSMQKGASRGTTPNQPATLRTAPVPVPKPRPAPVLKRPAPAPVARPAVAARPPAPQAPNPPAVRPPVTQPTPPLPTSTPVRDVDVRASTSNPAVRPQFTAQPTTAFRATQAARAQNSAPPPKPAAIVPPRKTADPNSKECPHCTATLPLTAQHCRCGFNFGSVAELPALSLSPGDLASILGALGTLPPSGNR